MIRKSLAHIKTAEINRQVKKAQNGLVYSVYRAHVKADYHGAYAEKEVRERTQKAEEYIEDIEKLLN